MNGRDFSAELFGPAPAPAPSGRDFSAELFGSAPAPAPVTAEQTPKLFTPPDQQDPQAALRRAISDREAVKRELARLSPNEIENRRILETELVREQQKIDYYRQKTNEPAAVTPAAPAPVRPSVQPKPAVTPFEGSPVAGDDLVAAIQPIETPAKPMSVLEGVKAAPLPTEDPLLRPEFVDQVQKQFNVMPEAQRNAALAEMVKRTDMYGRAARVIAGRYEAMDKAKSTVAREQFDPRLEVQAQRLIKQGASAETAESIARQRGLTVGPGRDLAQIGRDIAGEEAAAAAAKTAEEMEGAGFLSRVGAEARASGRRTSLGATQIYADLTGDTDLQKDLMRYQRMESAMGEAIPKGESQFEKSAQQALATLTTQAPMIVLSALTGTALPVLGQAAFDAFMQSYGEARGVNKSPAEAATRAGLMAVAEVVFERYGLAEQLKGVRGMLDRIPTNQIAGYLATSFIKDLPAEQATTLSQFLTDKLPQIGLRPDAGLKEYLEQAGETLRQTVLQSGAAGATIFGAGAGARAVLGPREEEAKFDAEAIARSKGFLAGAPAAPEAKPEPEAKPTPAAEAPAKPIVPPTKVAEAPKEEPSKIKEMFGELEAVSGLKPTEEAPTEAPVVEPAKAKVPETKAEEAPVTAKAPAAPTEKPAVEPEVPAGYVRVYHSGSRGEGDFGRWVSTNRDYASNYRPDLPLFFTDIPSNDPRVNNPDFADQGVKQGFTFNFELTPQEAATLKEIPREKPAATKAEAPTPPKEEAVAAPTEKPPLLDESNVQRSKKPPEQGGRHPQVQAAAMLLEQGQMGREEYEKYVDAYKPIYPIDIDKMYPPSTTEAMQGALRGDVAKARLNTPIADGTRVGLRMDLPALERGVPVVSIHEGKPNEDPRTGKPYSSAGDVIGYGSTGYIKDVFFAPRSQEKSLKMGYLPQGKNPLQTAEGTWVNMSPEEVAKKVQELKDDPAWTQVGFDPHRHGYFYDRNTREPVIKADEMFQIGNFLLAKNVQYAPKEQFLYSLEPSLGMPVTGDPAKRSPSFKREVAKLNKQREQGKITDEEFARRIDELIAADDRRRTEKDIADLSKGRTRGADYIRQRLLEAKRRGDLSPEAVDLAEWLITNNPQLVEDLGIAIKTPTEGGVGGMYNALAKIIILMKERGSDNTVVHEILHHLERMMPADVQAAIRKEWTKQFLKAQKNAKTPEEKLYFNALSTHHFDGKLMSLDTVPAELRKLYVQALREMGIKGERVDGSKLARHLLQNGKPSYDFYQYYNPSEFWAVNGSDIVRGRYDAIRGGVLTRLKNWLRELGEKIKAIFGLPSDAPIIKALDSVAKSDGKFVSKDLLSQAQTLFSIKPNKKQTDTPEFKRWFGESKVVDENGEPMIMYHGTTADFDVFDTTRRAIAGEGSFFSSSPMGSFAAGAGGNIMPVYLSIKNPKVIDLARESDDVFKDRFIKQGHDGVVMMFEGKIKTAVAFYPEQIKSATGNIGTFDPTNPNILYSIEPEAKPAPREAAPAKTIEPSKIDRQREAWTIGRDELGRPNFGPGAKAYDAVARLANIVLDKVAMKPISPELGRAMRNMKVQVGKAQKTIGKIGKELSKLSPQERALISDVIEGEVEAGVTPPQHVLDYAAAMVEIMTKQGQELVRLGMLSQEAYNRWENKYLPRFYLNNLGKETKAWADATKRLLMKQPMMQGIKGQQLKSRGMYRNVYVEDLPYWLEQGWEQRDTEFNPKTSTETVVWRDYTREEREQMGEIRDAMFRFVMGYNASQRDIALGRLYENLAENYASKSPIEGYVQVPDTKIEGTQTSRYGKLAGMYVPREIMDHLVWNDQAMANGLYKLYRAGLGRWKEGKTVLNPTAHANNVFSNFTMAHFAGVSYWDVHKYAGALRDFVKNNDMLKEAEDIGLFTGTFSQAEMVEKMPPELKQLANMTESQIAKYGDKVWDLLSYTIEWDGKKYGVRPVMKWMYENEDFFFRYLIYRDARNRGMEPEDAREYSNQFIFTYDDLPAGARLLRDVGMPFFSYTYKVVPVLARTALEYPWRFAAPAAAVYMVNAMMYAMAAEMGGDDDDWWSKTLYKYATDEEFRKQVNKLEESERKNLPPWMKGKSSLGTEKAIRLGMDDVTGLPLFLDISRIFPGGDLLDAENNAGGVAILQPLTPSNPVLTSLVAMFANKDMFLGKDIVSDTDTDAEKARKRAAWLWKQWAPAISVGNYHFDRGMNTIANMTGEPITIDAGPMGVIDYTGVGRDGLPVIPKYSVMQTFGVKVRPYDLETSEAIEKSKQDKLIKDLATEIRKIDRLEGKGALSPKTAETMRDQAKRKQDLLKDGMDVEGKEKK